MNRKLPLVGVSVLTAASLALAGCTAPPAGEGTSTPASGKDVTITYSNFISAGGNEKNLETIVDAFEKENEGITVEVKTLPYADYFTALQTDLAGGTVSDVFDIEFANYAGYQKSGVLAELEGVDRSVYQTSLADAYATDGKQYALPSSFSNVVLFYNTELFDKAGLEYPTAEWTWEDEKAAAEKLTDANAGVWGDYQPISYHEFYKAVAQAGGQFLTDDGKLGFNSPEGIAAAKWLVEKSGKTMPTAEQGAGTPDFDSKLFADGKLAMWHSGIWMFGTLADADIKWDIAVEPGGRQHASALFSNAVGISATSKNKDAAMKFAEFLTSSKTMVDTRLNVGWELPPIADEAALSKYLDATPPANRQAVFDSVNEVALAPSIGDGQAEMQDIITEELTEAAAGRKTVDEALAAAEKRISPLLG